MNKDILEDAFYEASLKVDWAEHHIQQAEGWFRQYVETDCCEIVVENNPRGGKSYFMEAKRPRIGIWLSIGDAFHWLNSSLDYIATGMMRAKGASTGRIHFPCHDTRDTLRQSFDPPKKVSAKAPPNRRIAETFPGIDDLIVDTICAYKGGNFGVWEIRRADNIDKHNLIIPVITLTARANIAFADVQNNNFLGPGVVKNIRPGQRLGLIDDRDGTLNVTQQGTPSASITFAQTSEVFAGQPIYPTLFQCVDSVREVHQLLREFAF